MLKIYIHCIKDGEYALELSCDANSIDKFQTEGFFGNVDVKGKMYKVGNRYTVNANVSVSGKFICDRSLTEYIEKIEAEFNGNYLADTKLYIQKKNSFDDDKEFYLPEDEKYLDLTNEVAESILVNIPMKKIAPEFRDKSIDEIFPEIFEHIVDNEPENFISDKWSKLKDLKLN